MTETEYKRQVYMDATRICTRYRAMKRQLVFLRREILHAGGGAADGMPRGSGTGDPTARKAARLITALSSLETKIQAIETAYNALPDEAAKRLIRKNVFDGIPITHVDVPMSESTCKRIREAYILQVAIELGLYW